MTGSEAPEELRPLLGNLRRQVASWPQLGPAIVAAFGIEEWVDDSSGDSGWALIESGLIGAWRTPGTREIVERLVAGLATAPGDDRP